MEERINTALIQMANELDTNRKILLRLNAEDVASCDTSDLALYDRLYIDNHKIDGMIESLNKVIEKPTPLNKSLYKFRHENGIEIENKTVPFGTILIVYESRPDVTVEATSIALKSGNKILLKGGKEAVKSNTFLHACWENSLKKAGLNQDYIRYLNLTREQFQEFLRKPDTSLDLIIPRGGERLIEFVMSVAPCPVLVSGRGNNFLYVSDNADLSMARSLILQSKISKISACNALDKVLIHENIGDSFLVDLNKLLEDNDVEIVQPTSDDIWMEEFLDKKIVVEKIANLSQAIDTINKYSGKHSATIVSRDEDEAALFMEQVDCAAVYHNASTRFTDGYEFGLGAEMAISTGKLHHRGPLGIEHLVTNKWYIKGNGQTR